MGIIGGELGYRLLRGIASAPRQGQMDGSAFAGKSKLEVLLGRDMLARTTGKSVLDFGCGEGAQAVELAERGAGRVIGLDIQPHLLEIGRQRALARGLAERVVFASEWSEPVDVVVCLDAFEHFSDPAEILATMFRLLKPGGCVLASFGPTWYHPLGGHLFSVFPWSHLVFTEAALIRWRGGFKTDGATRFGEVAGGLNQMTIGRFETLVRHSAFEAEVIEAVPIRRLAWMANSLTREFTTAVVRAVLRKPLAG